MTLFIQSNYNEFDCYKVEIDENGYIEQYQSIDVSDLANDKYKNVLSRQPDYTEAYFQIGPSYNFKSWTF
jgi:hypothetical protein